MTLLRLKNLFTAACIACLLSGCSSLPKIGKTDLPAEATISDQDQEPQPAYFVEMHSNFGKPKLYQGTIEKPTRVQEALEDSGALRQFSSMSVDLYRAVPGGRPLKLAVDFKGSNQVRYEQDYALHPGDRLVVKPKSDSPMEKLVSQVFGEF